jgi:hypothetical protein
LKWDQALFTDQLAARETINEAYNPATLTDGSISNYGFGWEIIPKSSLGKIVFHTGSNPGYKTIIVRYLDAKKTLIMLNNNTHPHFESLREAIDKILIDEVSVE